MNVGPSRTTCPYLGPTIMGSVSVFCIMGLAPGLSWLDSGELMAASAELGIAHPPGMPVFILIHKAVSLLIPIGDIAFRGNLASALLGAMAVVFACRIARRLGAGPMAATLGAVATMVSPVFVLHTTTVEVYSGVALITMLTIELLLAGHQENDRRYWVMAALILGLSIGGHHAELRLISAVVMAPLLLRHRQLRLWLTTAGAAVAGIMVCIYLPIRSALEPWRNWGDPSSLTSLWDHLWGARIRAAYGEQMGSFDMQAASTFAEQMIVQVPVPAILGLFGLALIARRKEGWILMALLLVDAAYSIFLNPMGVRDQQNGIVATMVLGVGVAVWFSDLALRRNLGRLSRGVIAAAVVIGCSLSFAGFPAQNDRGLGRLLAAAESRMEAESLAMVAGDNLAAGWAYRQVTMGARPDVAVIVRQHVAYPSSVLPVYKRLPHAMAGWRPNANLGALKNLDSTWPIAWEWSHGLDSQVRPKGLRPMFPLFHRTSATMADYDALLMEWTDNLRREKAGKNGYDAAANLATDVGQYRLSVGAHKLAIRSFEWATRLQPDNPKRWTNLGVALSAARRYDAAIKVTYYALHLAPQDSIATINLGRYQIHRKNWNAAAARLRPLVTAGTNATALGLMGVIKGNQGDLDGAQEMFRQALSLDPNQPEAKAGMQRIKRAAP